MDTLCFRCANKLFEHFSSHFVPQKEVVAEQVFWLPISKYTCEKPPVQPEPVPKEIPRKLLTISLVKDSFNKMRSHVNNFDKVITVRTKVTETEVDKCSVERKCFENECLLEHILYQDILCIAMHADVAINHVVPRIEDTLAYAELE
ncbi:hypothetical protein Tco_0034991 [Tanacetum coccineum]